MRLRTRLAALAVTAATAAVAFTGSASAATRFPDFSVCPTSSVAYCLHIQSYSGHLTIKGFQVPIGESFAIRGGLAVNQTTASLDFVAPTGASGVYSKPIQVPGGILGIRFPLPGNAVTAKAALAGRSTDIRLNLDDLSLRIPLKLQLSNPLIGPGCRIGSEANPVWLNLITGTTNPPPPNRPITGQGGYLSAPEDYLLIDDNINVDNAFAVPGASACGLGLGLINELINAKLRIPSAAGNNEMVVGNDIALRVP